MIWAKNLEHSLRSVSCMSGVKSIDSLIKANWYRDFFLLICTDIRQAEYNYKHQRPIKDKWMGSGQMGPRHPYSIWYVIMRQKHGQEIDPWMKNGPLFTDIFGKQAILSLMLYLLFICVAWFFCTPALSMKCEATEWNKLLIWFTHELFLFKKKQKNKTLTWNKPN